jgi:ATP-dependent Clp protease ATP-binding subunit ClpC
MAADLPRLDDLVSRINREPALSPADRVGLAVQTAEDLGSLGDQLVTHYVQAAREAGCSWSQIGGQLGVSKQAAQQGFVAPAKRRLLGRRRGTPSGTPFDRWTDAARNVVVVAQEEARALGHHWVGTEHVLLGLLAENQTSAGTALGRFGVEREAVLAKVESIIGRGTQPVSPGAIAMTARTKKVFELAVREAEHLGQQQVEPGHLLLGLVREGEGVAAQILVQLGADLARVRRTVLDLLAKA